MTERVFRKSEEIELNDINKKQKQRKKRENNTIIHNALHRNIYIYIYILFVDDTNSEGVTKEERKTEL